MSETTRDEKQIMLPYADAPETEEKGGRIALSANVKRDGHTHNMFMQIMEHPKYKKLNVGKVATLLTLLITNEYNQLYPCGQQSETSQRKP